MTVCSECWSSGFRQRGTNPGFCQLPPVRPGLLHTPLFSPHSFHSRAALGYDKISFDVKPLPSITCAKKKSSNSKTVSPSQAPLRDWTFVELSATWDHVFQISCHAAERAIQIRSIAEEGERQWGRGCVLLSDRLVSVPTRSKGFGGIVRRPPPPADDDLVDPLPATSAEWSVQFIPRAFILDPASVEDLTSSTDSSAPHDSVAEAPHGIIPVISKADLFSLIRTLGDLTRLLTLSAPEPEPNFRTGGNAQQSPSNSSLASNSSSYTETTPNSFSTIDSKSSTSASEMSTGGLEGDYIEGEEPYQSSEGDVLLVVSITLDGQAIAGGDVIELLPDSHALEPEADVESQVGLQPRYRTRGLDC